MKNIAIHIMTFFCFIQIAYSQVEDGVVSLDIPARNSLMFNRYLANPTFSFVREQNKYITITNKRELVGIQDAPLTYLANYSGRIKENIGAAIGVYQQSYGVLTTFGGVVNFAYNVRAQEDSNFTFGINIGAYKSGLDNAKVVTNFGDPSLDKIPSNFLLTANPGLNYGTGFMDFGVSLNNIITYNLNASELLEENPKKGVQGHMMYTGYFRGYGFLSDSRFSALARSEFQKEATIISGVMMLTVPKGIWAQVGYNTMYGATAGLGINVSKQIAIEYNYEKPFVGLTNLGVSHEITLAYKFDNANYYDYSRDDDMAGLFSPQKKRKKRRKTKNAVASTPVQQEAPKTNGNEIELEEEIDTRWAAQEQAKEVAKEKAKIAAEEQKRLEEEKDKRVAAEEEARIAKNEQARLNTLEQQRLKEENAKRLAKEEASRIKAEELARLASIEQKRLEVERAKRLATEEVARKAAEEKARIAAEEQSRLAVLEQERLEEEKEKRLKVEAASRIAAEEQAIIEAEELAKKDIEEEARLAREEQIKLNSEKLAQERLIKNPQDEIGQSISELASETEASGKVQDQLLKKLETAVAIKEKDLKDLKEENDLSEQNIFVAPKPFKSITAENEAIELLKINLDTVILRNKKKIAMLESLVQKRERSFKDPADKTNLYYKDAIALLKRQQEKAVRNRVSLVSSLEQISKATDFERKRRIKRAAYDNDQDRYSKDRRMLESLKQTIETSQETLTLSDFDFGRERKNNIQILKNIAHVTNGYYLVLAVHTDVRKRDNFLINVMSSGNKEVDFFYDVNTSEYFIYSEKYDTINEAERAVSKKPDQPYNDKLTLIKIEN